MQTPIALDGLASCTRVGPETLKRTRCKRVEHMIEEAHQTVLVDIAAVAAMP